MAFIRQDLNQAQPVAIQNQIPDTLRSAIHPNKIQTGESVAVAVGSRGIDQIDAIVKETVRFLLQSGLRPIIVPAMGSHGGGTPESQKNLLASYGITEITMGVPIKANMDVDHIGTLQNDVQIFFSADACACDHIVVINRIKPHTKFRAEIESGLCKMLVVGLGKKKGASEIHQKAVRYSFTILEEAASYILKKQNILCGVGIVEDGYGHVAHIEAMPPATMILREKELLKTAGRNMARIPFPEIDVLIIDQIGKDISGIGMDSNVTGRHRDITGDFHIEPHVGRIFVRDFSPHSDGNANGIGLADFTTQRLVDAIDWQKTYTNAIAAISPEKAAIPMCFDSDRQAVEACLQTCGAAEIDSARIARIKSTKDLQYIQISKSLSEKIENQNNIHLVTEWSPLQFSPDGNLADFPALPPQ